MNRDASFYSHFLKCPGLSSNFHIHKLGVLSSMTNDGQWSLQLAVWSTGLIPATHAGHSDDQCLAAFLSDLPFVILPVTFSGDHTLSNWSLLSLLPGSPFPSVAAFQASPWSQHPRSLSRCFCSSRKSEGRWCGQGGELSLSFHPS